MHNFHKFTHYIPYDATFRNNLVFFVRMHHIDSHKIKSGLNNHLNYDRHRLRTFNDSFQSQYIVNLECNPNVFPPETDSLTSIEHHK